MVMSRDQNAGQSMNIWTGNKSFGTVQHFKYLGTTLTNQNSINEENKSRLKLGNACLIRCRMFRLPVCYPERKD
jgi:hypothetical protein